MGVETNESGWVPTRFIADEPPFGGGADSLFGDHTGSSAVNTAPSIDHDPNTTANTDSLYTLEYSELTSGASTDVYIPGDGESLIVDREVSVAEPRETDFSLAYTAYSPPETTSSSVTHEEVIAEDVQQLVESDPEATNVTSANEHSLWDEVDPEVLDTSDDEMVMVLPDVDATNAEFPVFASTAEGSATETFSHAMAEPLAEKVVEDEELLVGTTQSEEIQNLLDENKVSERALQQAIIKEQNKLRRKATREKIWTATKEKAVGIACVVGAFALSWVRANNEYAKKKNNDVERVILEKPDTAELGALATARVNMSHAAHRAKETTVYAAQTNARAVRIATRALYLPGTALATTYSALYAYEAMGANYAETAVEKVIAIGALALSSGAFMKVETLVSQERDLLLGEEYNSIPKM